MQKQSYLTLQNGVTAKIIFDIKYKGGEIVDELEEKLFELNRKRVSYENVKHKGLSEVQTKIERLLDTKLHQYIVIFEIEFLRSAYDLNAQTLKAGDLEKINQGIEALHEIYDKEVLFKDIHS